MIGRVLALIISVVLLLAFAFTMSWIFRVDYFFNAFFVSMIGLALSDVIYNRWFSDEIDLPPGASD